MTYEYNTLDELMHAIEQAIGADPEMFVEFSLEEVLDDGVTAGLHSKELADEVLALWEGK